MRGVVKYGWDGLKLTIYSNTRKLDEMSISKDPVKIFEFLGYDYDVFKEGFDEIEEIFDYVISGKYFNYTTFLMENLRHIDRKRNKKRKSYNEFLQYIEQNNIKKEFKFKPKDEYLNDIAEYFPEANLLEKIEELRKKDKQNSILATKFNGKLVMVNYPTLKDKALGHAMTNFKESLGEWKDMFMQMETFEIMHEFDSFMINSIK